MLTKTLACLLLPLAMAACGGSGGGSALPAMATAVAAPASVAIAPFAVLGDSISSCAFVNGVKVVSDSVAWPTVAAQMTGRTVANTAVPGSQEPAEIELLPNIPTTSAYVVFAGGSNDVDDADPSQSPQTVALRVDDAVAKIQAAIPGAKVIFFDVRLYDGISASSAARVLVWNQEEKSIAARYGYSVIDDQNWNPGDAVAYPDGLHPSSAQVQVIASAIAGAMR